MQFSPLTLRRIHRKRNDVHPVYHFTPPANWLNDPNGLVRWRGKYHMFYQHNPQAPVWGDIHWGHAVSDDLMNWRDLPIALAPTPDSVDEGGIWSGCIVKHGDTAFAFYTGVKEAVYGRQTVCIATSQDEDLVHWEKYEGNPVIAVPPAEYDGCGFRDPYVWREANGWYMVIGAGIPDGAEAVLLYRSDDLYNWEFLNPLLVSEEQNMNVYECPSFFPLGDRWVLLVSIMPLQRVEYFVGVRWKNHFMPEQHGVLAVAPFYAALAFQDDLGRRLLMGWLQQTPEAITQETYDGAMSTPMELSLLQNGQLAVTPVKEALKDDLTSDYRQFQNVIQEDWLQLAQTLDSRHLKLVVSDDVSKVIFIDGTIVEYFNFPEYNTFRAADLEEAFVGLVAYLEFPLKRLGVWQMKSLG